MPKGWLVETKAIGDLNGDSVPDAAMVLLTEQSEELGLAAVGAHHPLQQQSSHAGRRFRHREGISTSRSPITC